MTDPAAASPVTVTLYTKPGCHLCEVVKATIERVAAVRAVRLVERNILDEPADYERFKLAIPVVFVGESEVARYRISEQQLLEIIDAHVSRLR